MTALLQREVGKFNPGPIWIFVIIAFALVTYAAMTAVKKRLYPWETA